MKYQTNVDFKKFNKKTISGKKEAEMKIILVDDSPDDVRDNMKLLDEARGYWESLRKFRERRRRSRRYNRGDQWSDLIRDPKTGEMITEEQYIKNQGKVPLKQNQIRQLMKNLIGQYRSNPTKTNVISRTKERSNAAEMMTNALQYVHQINMTRELDARAFEEFAISGAAVQKLRFKYWKERNLEDAFLENVNPARLFFNSDVTDIRLFDLRLIGEIIDTTLEDVISAFAKSKKDEEKIKEWFGNAEKHWLSFKKEGLSAEDNDYLDFYTPRDHSKCRLYEIWFLKSEWRVYAHDTLAGTYEITDYTMKDISTINLARIQAGIEQGIPKEDIPLIEAEEKKELFWCVKFLTPNGYSLFEGETPYQHEEHPYAITLYPLIDGEVWGFVEDIIDQQRYINRLMILMDFIIGASAKGVLLVPEDVIPDYMTPDDFAEEWTKFNSTIIYKPAPHQQLPKQISSNSTNIGINEMMGLQMKLLNDISGVHSAIQGQSAGSGKPASLYAQEAQNATLNTLDFMHTFGAFKQKRDGKLLKIIKQFYKEERYLSISGRDYEDEAKVYDPKAVQNIEFDITVTQGNDTAVYRQIMDEMLVNLFDKGAIDVEMYLENTSIPYADKLLNTIRKRKEQMQQGQPGEMPPEVMNEAIAGADPKVLEMLSQKNIV